MSRVFKSHLCVKADPCQLELPDPDIFLSDNQAQEIEEQLEPEADNEVVAEDLIVMDPLEKAREEAALLVDRAQAEAEQIVAAAKDEAERIRSEAEQAGAAEGRQSGLSQIRQESAGKLAQALTILSTAELEHQRRVLESEPEILKLAVAIASKIINAELKLEPRQQLAIVKQALSRFDQAATYKIRINPNDLELLKDDILPDLQNVFSGPKTLEIIADAAIAPGGSYIETEHGNIDARLKTQLELVAGELLKIGKLV